MAELTADDLMERGIPAITRLLDLANQDFTISYGRDTRAPAVAYGLFMNLVHQVHALLILRENDADHACAPLRRSVEEHAAFLVWLADQGEKAVDALNRGLQYTLATKLQPAAKKAGMAQDEQTQKILAATLAATLPRAETHLLQGSTLVDEYLGPVLNAVWTSESGFSHPSLHVVRLYTEDIGDDQLVLQKKPRFDATQATVAVCLFCTFLGALAFNKLLDEPIWEEELRKIADDLGLSMELPTRGRDKEARPTK